jgi:hypothetical protein
MPVDSRNQLLRTVKQRKYLNKEFDSFRGDLYEYARIHFPDRIKDFSETSLGGLFLELAAYVGDVQSFYLDYQFHELNPETAVEARNIQAHITAAGVEVVGASPSVVEVVFSIEVPADNSVSPAIPQTTAMPILYAGTRVQAQSGIQFELTNDIDFADTDNTGALLAVVRIASRDSNNQVTSFVLERTEICISGFRASESFTLGSFEPFKKITLAQENITQIVSVKDALGNNYYEVGYLAQDTIYKALINSNEDKELVQDNLQIIPCPYRFLRQMAIDTRLTTLTFGGGNAESIDNDIVPDPSEFALPLYGKQTFSRFTLNPNNLLQTTTLGVIGSNTTITVEYRYGGGLSHNIGAGAISNVINLIIGYPRSPSASVAAQVRQSLTARNDREASGGEDAPNLEELKLRVGGARAAQSRIVTKEDLLARVYTMPANFGRVFRASIRSNPNNPLSSLLYIISRNSSGSLIVSPDSLKKNLAKYLNSYRMISDAIDVLDAQVINLQVEFVIVVDPSYNRALVLNNVLARLRQYFNIKFFEIDQPIVLDDIRNIIYNNTGVLTLQSLNLRNVTGTIGTRTYSDVQFDPGANTNRGLVIGPPGSIFEIRFKDNDLIGSVV